MREIKFRAWDNKNKHWLMGYEYPNLGGFSLVGEAILFGQWGSTFDKFLFEKDGLKGTDLIIEQYTGLIDKNGKDIYEGDICRILYTDWASNTSPEISLDDYKNSISSVGRIEYFAPEFNIVMKDRYGDFSPMSMHYGTHGEIEVIGNIHENPELLK